MITSLDNEKLKTIRKLQQKRWRERLNLFVAEGEDLVDAAAAAGWEPEFVLRAGVDVEPRLLGEVSGLGSGTRVVGVYAQRWVEPHGRVSVYLHGVRDPGNVGTISRSVHAFADGAVILGPDCADPFSPKAVRASMGSIFARPPARSHFNQIPGWLIAMDASASEVIDRALLELSSKRVDVIRPPITVCLGAERDGLPEDLLKRADTTARVRILPGGPESLNVAMAATVALYELANRMRPHD